MRPTLSICIVIPRNGPDIEQKVHNLIHIMRTLNKVLCSLNLIVYYKNIERISEILGTVRLHYNISIIKGGHESRYSVIKRVWKNERSEFFGAFSLFYPSLDSVLPTMIEDLLAKKCSIAIGSIGPSIHQSKWVSGIQFCMLAVQRLFVKVCIPYQLRNITNPVPHNFIVANDCVQHAFYENSRRSNLILDILIVQVDEKIIEYPLAMSLWNYFTTLAACFSRYSIQSLLRFKLTQIKNKVFLRTD